MSQRHHVKRKGRCVLLFRGTTRLATACQRAQGGTWARSIAGYPTVAVEGSYRNSREALTAALTEMRINRRERR